MPERRTPALLVAILAATVAACSDLPQPLDPGTPLASMQPSQDIIAVQNRHTPGLMMRDGILGTGIGLSGATQSIVVYALTPGHAATARLPSRLEGYDVTVVATGRIDAVRAASPTTRARPAPSGYSVGHPAITAGTIGAKVKDAAGLTFILSNNHVIANSNNANIGDATLQPGPYDGGTSADQIGTLHDYERIIMGGAHNVMDAAIALVDDADLLGRTPDDAYGEPGTTVYSGTLLNLAVQKYGRTTGLTKGTVAETNLTVSVCYVPRGPFMCAEAATFVGQLGISDGTFSSGGDSGSLIVTDDVHKNPVGLLFAGSSTRTIANPIQPVLTRFGVSIDVSEGSGDDTEPPPPPPPPPGEDTAAPIASFSYSCGNSDTCSFTDTSTDDVGVTGWAWSGAVISTSRNPSHTFPSAGNYTVTLTVTDAAGNTSPPVSQTITCAVRGRLRCS